MRWLSSRFFLGPSILDITTQERRSLPHEENEANTVSDDPDKLKLISIAVSLTRVVMSMTYARQFSTRQAPSGFPIMIKNLGTTPRGETATADHSRRFNANPLRLMP